MIQRIGWCVEQCRRQKWAWRPKPRAKQTTWHMATVANHVFCEEQKTVPTIWPWSRKILLVPHFWNMVEITFRKYVLLIFIIEIVAYFGGCTRSLKFILPRWCTNESSQEMRQGKPRNSDHLFWGRISDSLRSKRCVMTTVPIWKMSESDSNFRPNFQKI